VSRRQVLRAMRNRAERSQLAICAGCAGDQDGRPFCETKPTISCAGCAGDRDRRPFCETKPTVSCAGCSGDRDGRSFCETEPTFALVMSQLSVATGSASKALRKRAERSQFQSVRDLRAADACENLTKRSFIGNLCGMCGVPNFDAESTEPSQPTRPQCLTVCG
jgi:hypothetical protein